MTKEDLKGLVMKYFNLEEKSNTESAKAAFAAAKLIDGTEIHTMGEGGFEVGQVAHVMTAEGEMVVAPSGEHELEDGTVLVIDGEGVITGLKTKDGEGEGSLEAAEEEAPEGMLPEMVEMAEEEEVSEEEAMEEEVPAEAEMDIKEAIIEAIAEVVAPELEAMKTKLAEMEEKMKEHYAATPAAASTLETKMSKANAETAYWATPKSGKFDLKKMQYEAVMARVAKNSKK